MIRGETTKRVRYAEIDKMGYLYHGNYPYLYEIGRTELMREWGIVYRDMEEQCGLLMPVTSMSFRFIRPALYDDLLTIRTELHKLPEKFVTFESSVFNEAGKLLNTGSVTLVFYDVKTQKTVQAPEFIVKKLEPHFEPKTQI